MSMAKIAGARIVPSDDLDSPAEGMQSGAPPADVVTPGLQRRDLGEPRIPEEAVEGRTNLTVESDRAVKSSRIHTHPPAHLC